jgi:hypothetical protein
VAHACNPSYTGGTGQEERGSKPAQANSSRDPISKNVLQKIGLVEWLKVEALCSSPSTAKKKEEEEKKTSIYFLLNLSGRLIRVLAWRWAIQQISFISGNTLMFTWGGGGI